MTAAQSQRMMKMPQSIRCALRLGKGDMSRRNTESFLKGGLEGNFFREVSLQQRLFRTNKAGITKDEVRRYERRT